MYPLPRTLLVRFCGDKYPAMSLPEFAAIAELLGDHVTFTATDRYPCVHVTGITSQRVCDELCARSMQTLQILEVYGEGADYAELVANMDWATVNQQVFDQEHPQSLCAFVDAYGRSLTQAEKVKRIHDVLRLFPAKVRVNLKNPTLKLYITEQMYQSGEPGNRLHRVFFGREVSSKSHVIQERYRLSDRKLLSTTTMEPWLAFVMANLGLCRPGTLVCDPFVGSGSVLLACAHFGSYCMGVDYDARNFRGEDGMTMKTSFAQYGTQHLLVGNVRADFSQQWAQRRPVFDAIVTDPPYGVREGVRRIGFRAGYDRHMRPLPEGEKLAARIPMRQVYPYAELLSDILQYAADTLVDGGRLVFWHAMDKETPVEAFDAAVELPSNDAMELLSISLQECSTINRRLVVYKRRYRQ